MYVNDSHNGASKRDTGTAVCALLVPLQFNNKRSNFMSRMKQHFLSISFMLGISCAVFLWACGGDKESTTNDEAESEAEHSDAAAQVSIPDGWTLAHYDAYSFAVPADWKGEPVSGLWYPAGESRTATTMPKIYLHCGGLPVMEGESADERLKTMFTGADPVSKIPVTRCSMSGYLQEVHNDRGTVHIALTLIEDVGMGMSVINFFVCSMPESESERYSDIFRKILDTVHCR
jgi:hypothetical protein